MVSRGDLVRFTGRGVVKEGVVTKLRMKYRRGRNAELVKTFGGQLGVEVAEVSVGDVMWTVPVTGLTVLGKAIPVDTAKATAKIRDLKAHNNGIKRERLSRRMAEGDSKGLLDLAVGQAVQVKYRDRTSWTDAVFMGWTGSGNIKFRSVAYIGTNGKPVYNRQQSTSPQFVRLPQ